MVNISPKGASGYPDPDHRPTVVKAALLAAGSFATAIGPLLAVAGRWDTPDATVLYAIRTMAIITVFAMGVSVFLWQRK